MKLRTLALAACALAPLRLAAQSAPGGLPDLNQLKPSAEPAFILLGVSPSAIERPRTPSDVAFGVLSGTEELAKAPTNYSASFAPYWLLGHPRLEWRSDTVRSVGASLARTLQISTASADVGTADSAVAGVAVGASTYLLSGRMSDSTIRQFEAVEATLTRRSHLQNQLALPQITALNQRIASAPPAEAQELRRNYTALVAAIRDSVMRDPSYLQALQQDEYRIVNAQPERVGMFWGVSGGAAWRFPDRVWERGRVSSIGVWSTLSYEGEQVGNRVGFTPVAVVRYLAQRGDTTANVVDAGTRLIFSGALYDFSVEGLVRFAASSDVSRNLWRVAGLFDYRVTPATWVTVSFGRDYQSARAGSLVAELGVKVNFAHDRYAPPAP